MNGSKFIIIIAILLMPWITADGNVICHQKFALCDSAKCQTLANNTKKVLCDCKVLIGYSAGKADCDARKPKINNNGQMIVTATYSIAEISANPLMTCASGNAWADCLNKHCLIDPNNPKRAFCSCDLKHSGTFQTRGGNCKTETCATTIWSGASSEHIHSVQKALIEYIGLTASPVNNCQKQY